MDSKSKLLGTPQRRSQQGGGEAEEAGEIEAADSLVVEFPNTFLLLTKEGAPGGCFRTVLYKELRFFPSTSPGLPLPLAQSSCDESSPFFVLEEEPGN